ncbi:folylpolyglutamate synthase/dihydrofolate synthase family protein [Oscillospiraceae bacterium PP1C4]
MTYHEALTYIHSLKRFSKKAGLERIAALMELLGNPQDTLKIVHVAGTNGKGSTVAMTAGILRAAGYRTGMYVSPFILDFRERIQVDREMIPPDALAEIVAYIRPLAEQVGGVAEFELVTAAAFVYFAQQNCDAVVLEVGIGGRFDATNVIKKPLLTVITAIGLDHTDILGDTVEKIAFEKCGIIKSGVPLVACPGQDISAVAVMMEQCAQKGCVLVQPNLEAAQNVRQDVFGTDLDYQIYHLHIPLAGSHQISNALTAVEAASQLKLYCGFGKLDQNAIEEGIASVQFPARMEIMSREPLVILDGAHNPAGAKVLADALALVGTKPVTAILGMLADKNIRGVLEQLAPNLARIFCVAPDNPRALPARELAEEAGALCASAQAFSDVREAYQAALARAKAENGVVLICGSLYLASEMRRIILSDTQ